MNRSLIVVLFAILLILATSVTLAAQGRGGHFAGGGHFGGGGGFNSTPVVRPGPSFVGRPPVAVGPGHFGGGGGFNSTPVVRPGPSFVGRPPVAVGPVHGPVNGFRPFRPVRPVVVPPIFSYYSPYIWPGYAYGGSAYYPYPAPAYSEPAYAYPDTQQPAVSQNEIDLAYQVGQLSAQVQQLQQQQGVTSYTQPSSSPERAVQQASTPTVFVFLDGRRMEVQNYAIIGETLWVLDERIATKIPMSDLDLDATQKENRSRGVRFTIPQK